MLFLSFRNYQVGKEEDNVVRLSMSYTNALKLKTQFGVLKDRQELKFAGLDSWKAVAELLPVSATLEGFTFSGGKRLSLTGTIPVSDVREILNFDAALRKYRKPNADEELFDPFGGQNVTYDRQGPQGETYMWRLTLELKRTELP
jgi:hypothetical protein